WPMIEWVLDQRYPQLLRRRSWREHSVIVHGAMEATLTPLMEAIEAGHPGIKVFSLPSVDHPVHGRHIELGVKGTDAAERVEAAFAQMRQGLADLGVSLGPELVRTDQDPK
ncbi:MAG: competence/damage-inducible protein A, partial [Pelomonas sp.]|nr:competence/damage-inducible protein A [Roseateles sp.]